MSNGGYAKAEAPALAKEYSVLFSSAINTNTAYIKDTAERQNAKKITEDFPNIRQGNRAAVYRTAILLRSIWSPKKRANTAS